MKDEARLAPFLVNFHGIPVEFWSSEGLSIIASLIGKPIYMDKLTKLLERILFTRIMVEIDVSKELVIPLKLNCHRVRSFNNLFHTSWCPSSAHLAL